MASTTGPDATTPSPSPVTAPTPPAKRSAAESPAPNSLKRKRGETKYYAVKAGFRPGIYANWNDCLKQISGYKNAVFRSFTSAEEARSFLTGEKSFSTTANSQEPTRFYGVQHGHVPGVYTNWAEAQAQIKNFSRPRYKKFSTRKEAEEFVRLGQKQSATPRPAPGMTHEPPRDEEGAELPADQAPLPSGAEDGFDPNVRLDPISGKIVYKKPEQKAATKLQPTATPGMLRIYTDGSSLKNGSKAAQAGVGVYFGPGDQRNVSEPLKGSRQTNQRAELTAILRALDIAPRHRDVAIFTDSHYAIGCVTDWSINWRRNNWVTAAGKPVENRDLVEAILAKIDERESLGVKTIFEWVKGHNQDPGNEAADKLAISGAMRGTADRESGYIKSPEDDDV